jgi:hypothetical protein
MSQNGASEHSFRRNQAVAGSLGSSSLALTARSSAAAAALAVSALERDGGPAKVRAAAVASERASPRASSARAAAARHAE